MSGVHTPGPWAWFGNAKNNEIYLATVNRGHTYVMGFERWGMRGAQPQFQPEGRGLVPASRLLEFEVGDKSVRGVEAAKADESVYRLDIVGIDCPDARLIAAAPDLLEACKALDAMWLEDWEPPHPDSKQHEPRLLTKECLDIWRAIRAAIAKAQAQSTPHLDTMGEKL